MSEYQPTYIPFSPDLAPTSPLNEGSNLPVTTGTNFKVNVNRNKTRRWVNARAFTYDGDDWGDDDSDDDDDADESKLREAQEQARQEKEREEEDYRRRFNSIQRRLGRQTSDKALPSLITNVEPAAGLKRSSGIQEPGKRLSLLQSPISAPAGPATASSSSPGKGKGSGPSESPSHDGRAPILRPMDIYKRMEDDRLKQQKEQQQTAPPPHLEPVSAPAEAPTQAQQPIAAHGRQQQVPRLEINTRDASSHSSTSSSPSSKPAQRVIRVSPPTEVHPVSGSAQPAQPQLRRFISRRVAPSSPEAPQAQQEQQQQQSFSPTKSPLHTSGSRGFRSVVHQAFDVSTPDASTPPESATSAQPLASSRLGTRSDSTITLLSPILPSGAFPQAASISAALAMGGSISEEPEDIGSDGNSNGCKYPTSPQQRVSPVPTSPVSPVSRVKIGHRRKMDPPDTQPGAERRAVVRESLVRMSSIPAEYGFAGDEKEKADTLSSNDVVSTPESKEPQQQQQGQQSQQGENIGDDSESRGRQLSQQSSIPEGQSQSVTAETSPVDLKRISTLDQCVLDINKYIEQQEDVARRILEANTDDEHDDDDNDGHDAEHGQSGDGPATSLSAPFSPQPQPPPRSPLRSPQSSSAKDTQTDPHSPPPLRLSTDTSGMHSVPEPTVSLATPTPTTPHDDEHDEHSEHSPYAMSLAAQQNAQLENEIMLSLTPKQGMTPCSGRSNSNASSVSSLRIAAGVEPSSSPNWRPASSAENVDESADEKAAGERATLSPVHEHEQEPASTAQGSQSTAASPATTAADASQPKTFSTTLSSARIWGGNCQSQGPKAQTPQSPIAEAEEAVPQPRQRPSSTMLTSPTHDAAGKRRSLILTELPDGLGYVEKERPQLSHKFSWEMDDSYVMPEEPPPAPAILPEQPLPQQTELATSAEQAPTTQPQTLSDIPEASTLATLSAVHSESPQNTGPLQTSALPPDSRGSDNGNGASLTTTITHISQDLPHRPASPQVPGQGPGHLRQRPSGQLLASLNTTNLSRASTVKSTAYSVDESTGTAERSDFSFLPSRTNTPPALPPRQQSPTTSVHDWQIVSPLSPRPRTAQTVQSGTPTAGSALVLSPTRSVSSLRARDPNLKSFRSILALKSNTKRIEAFRYAREEAARVDMGLDSWIQATLAANPEHADLVSSTGAGLLGVEKTRIPQRNLSARTFDKIASSSHVRQISGGGFAHLVHSQQVHVHVKGKDLLHSAGGAAKGLFSRGKHRFKHGVSAEAN